MANPNYVYSKLQKEDSIVSVDGKSSLIIKHPSYSGNVLVGWAQSKQFQETEEGLKALFLDFGLIAKDFKVSLEYGKTLIINMNRQIKTDDKNDLRQPESATQSIKNIAKGLRGKEAQTKLKETILAVQGGASIWAGLTK